MMKWELDGPWRAALLTSLVALTVFAGLGGVYLHYLSTARQEVGRDLAQNFALRIAQRTNDTISPVYMLASLVRQSQGKVSDFDKIASDLLQEFPLARALELAPAGVVRQVYPLRGNEAIVGHDLLKDRNRNKEAHVALAKRQLTVAGPFELLQGGLGAVARYPVFLPGPNGKDTFWGFVIVLVHVHELLANAGEMELKNRGFDYRICRVVLDVDDEGCTTFAGATVGEMSAPLIANINLPGNRWQLSVAPTAGWISPGEWATTIIAVIAGALIAGFAQFVRLRQLS